MQIDHLVPEFVGGLMGDRRLGHVDASRVHEDVEAAEARDHLVRSTGDLLCVR